MFLPTVWMIYESVLHTPMRCPKSQMLPLSSDGRALTKPWRQHQRVREECRGSGCWSGSAPFPVTQHRHRCDWEAGEGGSEGREESQRAARAARAGRDGPGTGGMIAADVGIQPRSLYSVFSSLFCPQSLFFRTQSSGCTNTPPFPGPLLCHRVKEKKVGRINDLLSVLPLGVPLQKRTGELTIRWLWTRGVRRDQSTGTG